jgi:hypothetical protein
MLKYLKVMFFSGIFLINQLSYAGENDVSVEMQTAIFTKTISYDRNINLDKQINIGVLVNHSNLKSQNEAEKFIENIKSSNSGYSINVFQINQNNIGQIKKVDIIYLTRGLSDLNDISDTSKSNKILTWASDPNYVKNGNATLGILNKNNRPKLIINLKKSKQEGQDFSSQLLKLCEIIE